MPTQLQDADVRDKKRARLLRGRFSLRRHLVAFAVLATAGIGAGALLAPQAHAADVWIVPAYLLFGNLVEYFIHRILMHRPLWPRALYRGHTLGHHRAFHQDSMAVSSWREMELVMMPWFTIGLFFVALAPVAYLVAWAFGPGAAGLLLLTAVGSFILYEGMHALYHFPSSVLEQLGLSDNRVFAWLCAHHRHHHRLTRMRWVNFNISLPLSDRLFGTLESEEAWQAQRDALLASPGHGARDDDDHGDDNPLRAGAVK